MRRSLRRRVRHWIANRGWGGLLREVWRRAKLRLAEGGGKAGGDSDEEYGRVHPFDTKHGVDTSGLIWGEQLQPRPREARAGRRRDDAGYWATGYYGVAPSVFRQAMDRLALDWPQTTFVDVGCGKGRAMMLALRYPWRRVVGVELAPELAEIARSNLARFAAAWRLRTVPVEVVAADVTEWTLPAGPLVLFLYHPFAAPVMTKFLSRLREAVRGDPREVLLLYMNPELDGLLQRTSFLERLWDECFGMTEEDSVADRFASRWERVVAYRVRPGG